MTPFSKKKYLKSHFLQTKENKKSPFCKQNSIEDPLFMKEIAIKTLFLDIQKNGDANGLKARVELKILSNYAMTIRSTWSRSPKK